MTENAKNSAAQNTIEDPPEYNAENAKNPKEGSDWLGGPQNGNETNSEADYTKHRFNETPSESTEGAYQQNGQSWLGARPPKRVLTGWEDRRTEMKPPARPPKRVLTGWEGRRTETKRQAVDGRYFPR
jgi:hypothetical protein